MTLKKKFWNAKYCGERLYDGHGWVLHYLPLVRWGFHIGKPHIKCDVKWEIHIGPFYFAKWMDV